MCYSHFHYSLSNPSLLSLLSPYLISLFPIVVPYSSLILVGFEVFSSLFPGDCWCVERSPHPFWSSGSYKSVLSAALVCSGDKKCCSQSHCKAQTLQTRNSSFICVLPKDTVLQPDFLLGITLIRVEVLGTIFVPAFSSQNVAPL